MLSGKKVFGFPRDLLLAFLSNIDAREHLLRLHPTIGSSLNEYALDTDDCEFSFSALVVRMGWKCPGAQALQALRSIYRLALLRRDPNSGIHIQSSQHCKYGRQTRMIEKARMWNNGMCYGSSGAARAARLLHFAGIHKLAKRCVRDKRTVRSYRKAKQL